MQINPCLRHEHKLVEHVLFKLSVQLHRITFNRHFGATALPVLIHSILLSPVIPNLLVLTGMHLFHLLVFSGEYFEHVLYARSRAVHGRN